MIYCCIVWTSVLLQVGSPGVNQARDYLLEQVTHVHKLAQEREDLETEVEGGQGLSCAVMNSWIGLIGHMPACLGSRSWLRMAET